MRRLLVGLIAAGAFAPSPAFAGTWKYEIVQNDGHTLTYTEDGKVTYYLGCGVYGKRWLALRSRFTPCSDRVNP